MKAADEIEHCRRHRDTIGKLAGRPHRHVDRQCGMHDIAEIDDAGNPVRRGRIDQGVAGVHVVIQDLRPHGGPARGNFPVESIQHVADAVACAGWLQRIEHVTQAGGVGQVPDQRRSAGGMFEALQRHAEARQCGAAGSTLDGTAGGGTEGLAGEPG